MSTDKYFLNGQLVEKTIFRQIVMGMLCFALVLLSLSTCSLFGDPPVAQKPDYGILSPSFPLAASVGTALNGSFVIANTGSGAGAYPVGWVVYISTDVSLDANDTQVDAGTISALAAGGASSEIVFEGTWPELVGSYYIIIEVSAGDDSSETNNRKSSTAISISALPV
ncbi:MAG: hypothetical protein ABIJ86_14865, partial [Spirochaetota bacterium]